MVMDQARGSPSDPGKMMTILGSYQVNWGQIVGKYTLYFSDTASDDDVALYHPPESSEDLSEMSLDTRPETPPLPAEDEPSEPATNDSWKSEALEPESTEIETPAPKPTPKSDVSLNALFQILVWQYFYKNLGWLSICGYGKCFIASTSNNQCFLQLLSCFNIFLFVKVVK